MNDYFIKNELELLIGKICDDVEIHIDENLTNVGCYLPEEYESARILIAKPEIIKENINNMFDNKVTFKETLYTITLHELGHHLDINQKEKSEQINEWVEEIHWLKFQLISYDSFTEQEQQSSDYSSLRFKIKTLTLEMEETAWNIAYELNQTLKLVDDLAFKFIKQISLKTYETSLKV